MHCLGEPTLGMPCDFEENLSGGLVFLPPIFLAHLFSFLTFAYRKGIGRTVDQGTFKGNVCGGGDAAVSAYSERKNNDHTTELL